MKKPSLGLQVGLTVLPIIVSLAITAILIIAAGADPRAVFEKVLEGAFRNSRSFANVLNFLIPLTLVSIGLVVTFTAGLWNIGVEGQMMMGAIFMTWGALNLTLPEPFQLIAQILIGMLGGGLWALLAGILKTRLGVHEIFGGVALNALANVLSIYLISGPWQPPEGGSVRSTVPFRPESLFTVIAPDFSVSLFALLIVLAALVIVWLALRGTRWGLQLKATGKNARSARLLGVPTTRSALSAFVVCGMLAGIAGTHRAITVYESLRPLASGGIGFLGLLVVLLAANRILLVPVITFLFAVIVGGSTRLKIALQLDSSLSGVLQETLVLMMLLFAGVRQRVLTRRDTSSTPEASPSTPAEAAHE
jgi:ABC-type uncharacterized transport system permease subunit